MIYIGDNASLSTDLDCQFNDLHNILHFYPTPPGLVQLTDPRLSDPRPMLDGSVINESVAGNAAIVQSKLNLNGVMPPAWFAPPGPPPASEIDAPAPPVWAARGDLAELLARKGVPNGYPAIDANRRLLPENVTPGPGLGTVSEVLFSFPEQFDITQGIVTTPGLNNGDNVGTWVDSSGAGHNLPSVLGVSKFYTNIVNGKPAVGMNIAAYGPGVLEDASAIVLPAGCTGYEIFAALKPRTTAPANQTVMVIGTSQVILRLELNNFHFYHSTALGLLKDEPTPRNIFTNVVDTAWTAGVCNILTAEWTGSVINLFRNGTLKGSIAAIAAPACGPRMTIGDEPFIGNYWDGDITEVLVYSQALSATDRQNVEKYLSGKYAVSVAAGTPVDPKSIPGLQGWWKADSLAPGTGSTCGVTWRDVPNNCWFGINGDTGSSSMAGPGIAPMDPQFYVEQLPIPLIPPIDASKFTTGQLDPETLPIAKFGEDHDSGIVPDPGLQGDPYEYLGRDMFYHHFLSGPPYQPQVHLPSITLVELHTTTATVTIRSPEPESTLFWRGGRPSFAEAPPSGPDIHITVLVPRGVLVEAYAAKQGFNNSDIATYTVPLQEVELADIIDNITEA